MGASALTQICVVLCMLWWFTVASTMGNGGPKAFYEEIFQLFIENGKVSLPMFGLTVPVLIAGAVCTYSNTVARRNDELSNENLLARKLRLWLASIGRSEKSLRVLATFLFAFPIVAQVITTIYRKVHGAERSLTYVLTATGNALGVGALVGMSFFLVPVTCRSPIIQACGWNHARATVLHTMLSWMILALAFAHGMIHVLIFHWKAPGNLLGKILPPTPCWTSNHDVYENFKPVGCQGVSDCSCFAVFRNFVGSVAVVGMLVLGLTSIGPVRQKFYSQVFYPVHVMVSPVVMVAIILHWNRAIFYMAGSVLYYMAVSVPIWLVEREAMMDGLFHKSSNGVRVVKVERIPCSSSSTSRSTASCCVSLTFEASDKAISLYRPGQYVKLAAPEISKIWHPFTMNLVPQNRKHIRVMFRAAGPFTSELAKRLIQSRARENTDSAIPLECGIDDEKRYSPPSIYLDGFYGAQTLANEVLQRDLSIIIAGGIGIAPYLTLLTKVRSRLDSREMQSPSTPSRRIVLHWVCRDPSFVSYIKKEYFESMVTNSGLKNRNGSSHLSEQGSGHEIEIIIHNTNEGGHHFVPDTDAAVVFPPKQGSVPFHTSPLTESSAAFVAYMVISAGASFSFVWVSPMNDSKSIIYQFVFPCLIVGIATTVSIILKMAVSRRTMDFYGRGDSGAETESLVGADTKDYDLESSYGTASPKGRPMVYQTHVSVEERRGRPCLRQCLEESNGAKRPALFCCGPPALMHDLRSVVSQLRFDSGVLRQRLRADPIAVFEEVFSV